jgi:hypothetical protein
MLTPPSGVPASGAENHTLLLGWLLDSGVL